MLLTSLRKRVGGLLFDGGLTGAAYLGRLHPRARPQRHGVTVTRDIPYRSSGLKEHKLDLYTPSGSLSAAERAILGSEPYGPPHPVVLYIHGGAFRILSKDTHWLMGLAFSRRGCLAYNINYRLAPRHPFPAALEDACAALEFVVNEAKKRGGDPSRLVLAGESAGANLALGLSLLTLVRRPEPWARRVYDLGVVPKVVLPMCGMLQVSDSERFSRRKQKLPAWIQDRLTETTDSYLGRSAADGSRLLADPLLLLEQLAAAAPSSSSRLTADGRPWPAFFASVGTRDPLLDDTRRLEQALRRLGVSHEVGYYPGELHAFQALVYREQARRCWQQTYSFIDKHLAHHVSSR